MLKSGRANPVTGSFRIFVGIVGVALVASVALGDVDDVVFSIEASSAQGSGVWEAHFADGQYWNSLGRSNAGGSFQWSLDEPVEIIDFHTGNVVATLLPDFGEGNYVKIRNDPQVNLGFAVQAGSALTTFTLRSTMVSFGALTNPDAQAGIAVTVQDFDSTGATLTGIGPQSGAYLAQYNGFVPNGATFAEQLQTPISAGPFGIPDASENTGWQTVSTTVSNISSQIQFTLTAFDLASGTSSFEVVPEPASLLLLLAAAGLFRRR